MAGIDDGDAEGVRADGGIVDAQDRPADSARSTSSEKEDDARHASPLPDPPPSTFALRASADKQGEREPPPWWPPGATAETVAEARRLYETTGMSVPLIRATFGWTDYELRKLRLGENWTARPSAATPGPLRGFRPVGTDLLVYRLNRLITYGLGIFEHQAVEKGFDEKLALAVTALCRALEIMMRSERTRNGTIREKKNDDGYDFRDDPLWLAAEFARRNPPVAEADAAGESGVLQDVDAGRAADASR